MKYEVGTQWKTRGGWRAVVVTHDKGLFEVWHDQDGETHPHNDGCGLRHRPQTQDRTDWRPYDLISTWEEPRSGTYWFNIYNNHCGNHPSKTKDIAESVATIDRIACVEVNWVEGEGLS